jgi:hypothetical protein
MAVIFAIAIMSLVVIVAFTTADDERRSARASRESTLALYAAEAGLRATLGNWPAAPAAALNPGDSVDLGWTAIPNGGKYRAVIQRMDNSGLRHYSVVVSGRRANSYGGQSAVVAMVAGESRFKSAITSQGDVSMTGSSNGIIDAYDSDNAPYSPTTGDTVAVVSNGSISLYNAFTVRGDVKAASTIWNTSGVTGEVKPFAPRFPANPVLTCPAGGYSADIKTNANVNYSSSNGILYVEDKGKLKLKGANQYYFSRLLVADGGSVDIDGDGRRVDIFVDDWLAFAPGAIENSSGKPTQLAFWSCGAPANPRIWYVAGGKDAFYSLYAPDHEIRFLTGGGAANNHVYGAMVGASFVLPSAMRLHFDAALTRMPSGQLKTVSGSWAQLPAN